MDETEVDEDEVGTLVRLWAECLALSLTCERIIRSERVRSALQLEKLITVEPG